jgi:hypothetical protein
MKIDDLINDLQQELRVTKSVIPARPESFNSSLFPP